MAKLLGAPTVTSDLRDLRNRAKLSMREMAEAMGYRGVSSYQRYEEPEKFKKQFLPLDMLRRLRSTLLGKGNPPITDEEISSLCGVTPEHVDLGTLLEAGSKAVSDAAAGSRPEFVDTARLIPVGGLLGERDLPVYGGARGGPQGLISIGSEPVEFVRRPQPLLKVPGGFGVVLYGDSMEPIYRQGDILLVHPAKPPSRDDDALFVKQDDHGAREAIVKRLTGVTEKLWRVRQFTPNKEYDLPRSDWPTAMKIVGMYRR